MLNLFFLYNYIINYEGCKWNFIFKRHDTNAKLVTYLTYITVSFSCWDSNEGTKYQQKKTLNKERENNSWNIGAGESEN